MTQPIEFPPELPVVAERERIQETIARHQVVVLAGETGSGKTTQLPKMLLSMGYGQRGQIGHTQPRRLAARSVAQRIADELREPLGQRVGYKVRFQEQTGHDTAVKLMTDGILLAELQRDRTLSQYEVIIIDEAHERSLNIDFLLGVLHQLLPKRPDLKVIITSATIETERFSRHFHQAPVLEVSGRTYPVEIRYQPLQTPDEDTADRDIPEGVLTAIQALRREGPGDVLVFLSGEREIRDTAAFLQDELKHGSQAPDIIPLFARLSAREQNRVFQPHGGWRIVLATNVAETSLTVPGIRYVVDAGFARISRYSYRSKVQRLPVEPVSQASANQRAGRCGRVGPGICVRLYSEDDFLQRPEFTDPEILRTNLAAVILQMTALKLGDIRRFPFLQPPDERFIKDGLRLLEELAAIQPGKRRRQGPRLTSLGRQLGRVPLDPRLGRMLLAAQKHGCVREIMVITAALSIQDPRERPHDKQQKASELHQRFADNRSDFMALLNLWHYVQEQQSALSGNQFRRLCKAEFIHYLRIREWQDLYRQLRYTARQLGLAINDEPADYQQIHRAVLPGLLSHLGHKDEQHQYVGARQRKFYIFPGSGLFKSQPKWVMAAELVETSRLFARQVARIEPGWIEAAATHLVRRQYHEPHYSRKRGAVVATEQVTLYGLLIVPGRQVQFAPVDPVQAREIFIRQALVEGEMAQPLPFMTANLKLIAQVRELEEKSRRRDILIDEDALYQAYADRLPEQVYDDRSLRRWWRQTSQQNPAVLTLTRADLMQQEAHHVTEQAYPDEWPQGQLRLPLTYCFEPGAVDDGVSVEIPLAVLNQVSPSGFDWQVPALREALVVAWIKSLPKRWRRQFVPAPNYARAFLEAATPYEQPLLQALTEHLKRMSGTTIPGDAWRVGEVPDYLQMNFKVLGDDGTVTRQGRDLVVLQQGLQTAVTETLVATAGDDAEQSGLTDWTFGELPTAVEKKQGKFAVRAFPALKDEGKTVAIRVFDQADEAALQHRRGLRKLILLQVPSPAKYLKEKLPNKAKLALYFNPWGQVQALIDDCILAAIDSLLADREPTNAAEFRALVEWVRQELNDTTLALARQVEQCLLLGQQVQKAVKGKVPLALVQSYGDIQQHLGQLIYPGFVQDFGAQRLPDLERYLKALVQRVEKLPVDPNKDRLRTLLINDLTEQWQALYQLVPKGQTAPAELDDFRWALEEFRVSTYAQQLGTRFPVSEQRLKQRLDKLRQSLTTPAG